MSGFRLFKKRFQVLDKKAKERDKNSLYRGRPPTSKQISANEINDRLILDEAGPSKTDRLLIVGTFLRKHEIGKFRNVQNSFPSRKKALGEVKYTNTTPVERLRIYKDLEAIDYEIWDTYNITYPDEKTMVKELGGIIERGNKLSIDEIRYVYAVKTIIEKVCTTHKGKMDITIDNPPFDIRKELNNICSTLVKKGYNLTWYSIKPSRLVVELQVHDFVAGLDRDLRLSDATSREEIDTQYTRNLTQRFESKRKN